MTILNDVQNVTVSSGTLRTEDLLQAFIEYIPEEEYPEIHSEYESITDFDSEEAGYFLQDVVMVMYELAPVGYYFGAHPGDGACFGFWEIEEDE